MKTLSPMGWSQSSEVGCLKFLGIGSGTYEKDSFWAKWAVEPFGGAHDWLNSFSAYDTENGMSEPMEILNFDLRVPHPSIFSVVRKMAFGRITTINVTTNTVFSRSASLWNCAPLGLGRFRIGVTSSLTGLSAESDRGWISLSGKKKRCENGVLKGFWEIRGKTLLGWEFFVEEGSGDIVVHSPGGVFYSPQPLPERYYRFKRIGK